FIGDWEIADWLSQCGLIASSGDTLADQERAVPEAPDHEVPARAVPQAAEKEHGYQVAVLAAAADAVAAQRDIEVVAEPRRERQVPAPPEILNACGDVRP